MDPTDIFHLCKARESYDRLSPYIKPPVLSDVAPLFQGIGDYYKHHPAISELDWSAFGTWFLSARSGRHKEDTLQIFRRFLSRLEKESKSVSYDDVARFYVTVEHAARIAQLARAIIDGKADPSEIDEIADLVDDCNKAVGRAVETEDLFASEDLSSLSKAVVSGGWEWRLEELNISVGPLRTGDMVVLGARPETGKTTFTADQVSYMAQQMQAAGEARPILWVNNEERQDKVLFRIQQAALGALAGTILGDPPKAAADFEALVGKRRFLVTRNDAGLNSVDQINRLCREYNPCLIVFDQLDKVESPKAERDDLRLGQLYWWARDLAHKYGPVIAVSQADQSADGQEYVSDAQLRGSKTDKVGEADVIITLGNRKDPSAPNSRGLHIPKNKLFGGPRTDPAHRHGYWQVEIDPERARFEGKV